VWCQSSAAMWTRTAPLWAITQRVVVVSYRRFGHIFKGQPWRRDG
jgi:hypothetical protein